MSPYEYKALCSRLGELEEITNSIERVFDVEEKDDLNEINGTEALLLLLIKAVRRECETMPSDFRPDKEEKEEGE
jgi:hypothetical protein